MRFQELVYLVVVTNGSSACLQMGYPVQAGVSQFGRDAPFDDRTTDAMRFATRVFQIADVLLQLSVHNLKTAFEYFIVRLLLVYSKLLIVASSFVEQKVAERKMKQSY